MGDVLWADARRLCTAVQEGVLQEILGLLRAIPASAIDTYGYTALHYAARAGNTAVVDILIEAAADPNSNSCGFSALHRAAFTGHSAVVRTLLAAKADANLQDTDEGASPLHKAVSRDHIDCAELLLNAGAGDLRNSKGCSVGDLASDSMMQLLREPRPIGQPFALAPPGSYQVLAAA